MPRSATDERVRSIFEIVNDMSKELGKIGKDLDKYNKKNDDTQKKNKELGGTFTKLGGFIAGAFSTKAVVDFLAESSKIAREAEGIEKAFKRIGSKGLLDELDESVKGTVSEIKLMQMAVQASNFKIPMNKLGTFFQFATKRAQETGESVDYLVDSVVRGLGKRSPEVLDNLGISMRRLKDQMGGVSAESATIADLTKAFGTIADEELGKMGEIAETSQVAYQQMRGELEELQKVIGDKLNPTLKDTYGLVRDLAKEWKLILGANKEEKAAQEELNRELDKKVEKTTLLTKKMHEYQKAIEESKDGIGIIGKGMSMSVVRIERMLDRVRKKLKINAEEAKKLLNPPEAENKVSKKAVMSEKEKLRLAKERQKILTFISKEEIGILEGEEKELAQVEDRYKNILKIIKKGSIEEAQILDLKTLAILDIEKKYIDKKEDLRQKDLELARRNANKSKDAAIKAATEVAERVAEIEQKKLDDRQEKINTSITITQMGMNAIDSIISNSLGKQEKALDSRYGAERKNIEDSGRSEEEKAKLIEKLDKKKEASQRELALKEWRWLMIKSVADTASAVVEALPNVPLSVAVGTMGAINTGIIASNKPKFEDGGLFDGVGIVPGTSYSGDKVNARLNSLEGVVNPSQGRNIMNEFFRVANGGRFGNTSNSNSNMSFSIQNVIQGNVTPEAMPMIEESNERLAKKIESIVQNNGFDDSIINTQALAV